MEVVLRNEQVEEARAGDKLVFTGNLVVVPDIAMLTIPGERVQVGRRGAPPSRDRKSNSPSPCLPPGAFPVLWGRRLSGACNRAVIVEKSVVQLVHLHAWLLLRRPSAVTKCLGRPRQVHALASSGWAGLLLSCSSP